MNKIKENNFQLEETSKTLKDGTVIHKFYLPDTNYRSIKIVHDQMSLLIQAQRSRDIQVGTYRERSLGTFETRLFLPVTAISAGVKAYYYDSYLTIAIPCGDDEGFAPQQIRVQPAKPAFDN